jgi:hypothetical protein
MNFINNVPEEYKSWQIQIENLLKELTDNGWDSKTMPLEVREKWGSFEGFLTSDNEVLQAIIEKYSDLISDLCIDCGKKVSSSSDYHCEDCILEIDRTHAIEDISDKGFSYNNFEKKERDYIKWEEITEISLTKESHYQLEIKIPGKETWRDIVLDKHIQLYDSKVNFFLLLKNIPSEKLKEEDRVFISKFFEDLESCMICGYIAVYDSICLICDNRLLKTPNRWMIKNNQTLNDYNKERQLLYYTFDNRVLIQRIERSFEKDKDHKILFTKNELKEYKKEWSVEGFNP